MAGVGGADELHGMTPIENRLRGLDWAAAVRSLDERGHAVLPGVLRDAERRALVALWGDGARFRARVVMERHRFGVGEYRYFAHPLPTLVAALREACYPPLAVVANRWTEALRSPERFPPALPAFLRRCAEAGQSRPTPLLLRYGAGGYNCLHQDVYGDLGFPFQVVALLSRPGVDFTGGEFLLVEQRPRAQSVGEAVAMEPGDLLVFPNRLRPVRGVRGYYSARVRHGVSRVRSGVRYALGVIFHDAR
jgi:hypothetical protein